MNFGNKVFLHNLYRILTGSLSDRWAETMDAIEDKKYINGEWESRKYFHFSAVKMVAHEVR